MQIQPMRRISLRDICIVSFYSLVFRVTYLGIYPGLPFRVDGSDMSGNPGAKWKTTSLSCRLRRISINFEQCRTDTCGQLRLIRRTRKPEPSSICTAETRFEWDAERNLIWETRLRKRKKLQQHQANEVRFTTIIFLSNYHLILTDPKA